ncbi:MAG: CRISPR-associated helicase Cas3' [Saprospiraceae bacterium]|nr:CRISPR-associated helicase Cas3' [Saprospiraceae bacterium]MDW8484880.1 CRISPR-associated helicase Cas3' [Saprospiraceae bacterium]
MYTGEPLAKSAENGGLTLLEHTRHVVLAIEKIAAELGFPVDIARKGAILHDLGKAHPHFQYKIGAYSASAREREEFMRYTHRHEISSLGFLLLFSKEQWNTLIDLVVAHHKSVRDDPRKSGLVDLAENAPDTLDFHVYAWERWSPAALGVAAFFGIAPRSISAKEARAAIDYAVEYCERRPRGWSPWKGLLRAADHFASAFNDEVEHVLKRTFRKPSLEFFRDEKRRDSLYPLSLKNADDPRPHTIAVAPTGAGKTDFLLRRCKGRVFYTLPFQASINAMFDRIKAAERSFAGEDDVDVRLQHATSRLKVQGNDVEQTLQPLVGASVKVLTPHQIASIIFGTSGFETVMLDLRGTDVILDEIHTYTEWAGAMVREIARTLLRLDCRIHIGTATIPTALYRELLQLLGGSEHVYEVRLPDEMLETFNRHLIYKEPNDESRVRDILAEAFANGERVLLIHNTVKAAQEAYLKWKQAFPAVKIMLIHSRFRRKDRYRLEKTLTDNFNDRNKSDYSPCLVISTQVVEVSLDISFDRMITACAPLDALIQRFGRVNRVRKAETIGQLKPIHVLAPEGSARPYQKEIVERSFAQLPCANVLRESEIQQKIDAVYPTVDSKEIDMHLVYVNGQYKMQELVHYPKSVIVDALEIESVTCILESDRAAYLEGPWERRIELEIPVAWSTLRWSNNRYEQLQVGSWPFVVPQEEAEHQEIGLVLRETNNFL